MNWAYPVLMGAAVTTGVIVSRRTQRPLGLGRGERLAIGLGAFCGGMLGAKIGRRLPPIALRGVIVLVGMVAIGKMLVS